MGKKTRRGYLSQFPAHWKVYRMDKLLDRVKKKVDVKKTENYTQIGIRSHGKGIFYKEAVTGKELGNKSVFWVEPDCFVVNIVFAWEMAVAKTTQNDVGLIASHRFPMYKPKPELLDLDFLLYYFKMPLGKYLLGLASPGGAGRNKTLGQKEFAELEICIPPVNEQKEIVSILKTWDKAIALKEKLIEEKKSQYKSLLQLLLSGEKSLNGHSDKWITKTFEELGTFKTSSVDKISKPDEEEVKLINYMDVYNNTVIDESINLMQTTASKQKIESFQVSYGDVLFTPSSETPLDIGQSAVVKLNSKMILYSYHLIRFQLFDNCLTTNYKAFAFNTSQIRKQFAQRATGSTRYTLSISDFNEVYLSFPSSFKEQDEIAEILSNAKNQISHYQKELTELTEQKRGLMQQLLTGKKQVVV